MTTWLKKQHEVIYKINRELEKYQEGLARKGYKHRTFPWIFRTVLCYRKLCKKYKIREQYTGNEFFNHRFILVWLLTRFYK